MIDRSPLRIGIVGTGFVARHFALELRHRKDLELSRVLTRRPIVGPGGGPGGIVFPFPDALTNDTGRLIESSDIVFECTGDVFHATETIEAALAAGRPVMTLNPEFHVTTGSHFVDKGYLTEADGDQPGCTASLVEEATAMGFEPLVLGNMKGFLNRHPTPEDMAFFGEKQGISLPMVTSFTDGTKMQVEQALVGNFFGHDIACDELIGPETDDLAEAASILGDAATDLGRPITDYVLSRKLPHGVFVVARHRAEQIDALRYLKMGEGPYYTLIRNNIFVHLEPFKTIERIRQGRPPLLHNHRRPTLSVAAVAKRDIAAGERVERGCGSFDLRGICVRIAEQPGHLPIGLAERLTFTRAVAKDEIVTFDAVDLPAGRAVDIWHTIERNALKAPVAA
ncbi:MAG: hypothetical protein KDE35_08040 [Geminicoccaceae bacterium]|nr:hypothetical protein [Geminicoccaceae bacterium]